MASETEWTFMETGGANPIKSIGAIRKMIAPVVMQMAEDAYAACLDADALICLGVFSTIGQSIAEALVIPILHYEPTPLLPSNAFPACQEVLWHCGGDFNRHVWDRDWLGNSGTQPYPATHAGWSQRKTRSGGSSRQSAQEPEPSVSFDHDVINCAPATQFMQRLKELVESSYE